MNMHSYWVSLPSPVLSKKDVAKRFKNAIQTLQSASALGKYPEGEFKEDLFPAFGPGGAYSDEDEDYYRDDIGPVMPTITGDTGLFFYDILHDELWNYHEEYEEWLLWNY